MLMVSAVEGYLARLVAREVLRRVPDAAVAVHRCRPSGPDPLLDGAEVRYGSYEDPAGMVEAFRGIDRLLLAPVPSSRRDGTCVPLLPVVAAAGEAAVRHVVHYGAPLVTGREPTSPATTAELIEAVGRAGAVGTVLDTAIDPGFLAGEVRRAVDHGELAAPPVGRGVPRRAERLVDDAHRGLRAPRGPGRDPGPRRRRRHARPHGLLTGDRTTPDPLGAGDARDVSRAVRAGRDRS